MKNIFATIALTVIIGIGATSANAGVMLTELTGSDNPQPCVETTETLDWGIYLTELTGGIFGTNNDKSEDVRVDCGILMAD